MEDVTLLAKYILVLKKKSCTFSIPVFHYRRDLGHYSELLAHSGLDLVRSLRNTGRAAS